MSMKRFSNILFVSNREGDESAEPIIECIRERANTLISTSAVSAPSVVFQVQKLATISA